VTPVRAFTALRRAVTRPELWPAARATIGAVALFALALWLTRRHAVLVEAVMTQLGAAGMAIFVTTSAVAVLMPVLTNLPLVPAAALAWGPGWTAALLLAGWTIGAVAAFALARHARARMLRLLPSVMRHADIERLVHPRHRVLSLAILRATFPVDVLSYALGAFSPSTTHREHAASVVLGAAPFALLFAWLPAMPAWVQGAVFAACTAAFVVYTAWVVRRASV
jgi:uncharacterized membrane protein YdjX (TVP38/TMEM64 family)